ncbi:hypothetical protein P879_11856 [Paragonimus westermani]|uniref:Uncharacterized protein n=1 Tax=Paragonimus westermani TaxID=34504 RepID=A0A8T0D5E3_9TREM|nr:hypothetical protein P879_11856 [Paragonimus westermani]
MDEVMRSNGKRRLVGKMTIPSVKSTNFAELRPLSSPTGPYLRYCSNSLADEDGKKVLIELPERSFLKADITKSDLTQDWSADVDGQNISQNSKVIFTE